MVRFSIEMDRLSCFAMYFNSIAWLFVSGPRFLKYHPVECVIFLLSSAVVAILASKLLLRTIALRFSDQPYTESQETLLPPPSDEQRSTLSLPFLLRSCTPKTSCGGLLYMLFLSLVIIFLLKSSLLLAQALYFLLKHLGLEEAGIGLTFLGTAGVMALCPFLIMGRFHPLFTCLNLLCAGLRSIDTNHIAQVAKSGPFEAARLCLVFLSLQLIIPSVMSASNIPAHRHSRLLTYAICGVCVLYLALGGIIMYGESFHTEISKYLTGPIVFIGASASMHILTRALSDIIAAWRYGLNAKVANQEYPTRVRATHILTPVLIFAFGYLLGAVEVNLGQLRSGWAQSSILTEGLVLLIIPYCYVVTEERMSLGNRTLWWKYVVYAGGVTVVLGTVALLIWGTEVQLVQFTSLMLDAGIFAALLLWQYFGRFFP